VTPKPRAPPVTLDVALMRGALEEVPLGVATTRGGEILHANAALERLYGASPGELDGKPLEILFAEDCLAEVRQVLDRRRRFDGRLRTVALTGEEIHAEFHVERYMSSGAGVGGFVIVRDVTFEASALGRLLDQLGGAQFRVRVRDAELETVTAAIEELTGLSPTECVERPARLLDAVPAGERERVHALYRRLARGELATASAEITIRRSGGATALLQVRATGRRDTSGNVRHIDGVVTDAAGPASQRAALAERDAERAALRPTATPTSLERFKAPEALLEITRAFLQEVNVLVSDATSELGVVRTAVQATSSTMVPKVARELLASVQTAHAKLAAANALQRRVRRAVDGRPTSGPLINALEGTRTALAPLLGEHSVLINGSDVGGVMLQQGLDELTIALTYLGLRAYRLGGSGMLRIDASHRRSTSYDRRASREIRIEVVGEPPADNGLATAEAGSGLLATIPRHAEMLAAFDAVLTLLAAIGGAMESDDVTVHAARTVIRLAV
jgi:PAS domain S-box-containing protein